MQLKFSFFLFLELRLNRSLSIVCIVFHFHHLLFAVKPSSHTTNSHIFSIQLIFDCSFLFVTVAVVELYCCRTLEWQPTSSPPLSFVQTKFIIELFEFPFLDFSSYSMHVVPC